MSSQRAKRPLIPRATYFRDILHPLRTAQDTRSFLFSLYFKEGIDNSACLTYFICTKTLAMLPFFVSLLLPHYRELPNRSPQMSPQLASLVFFATVFAANFNCRLVKLLLSGKGPSAYPKNTNNFFLGNSESSS